MLVTNLRRPVRLAAIRALLGLGILYLGQSPGTRAADAPRAKPTVDFNRQIRPILSENCFACHGPDEKQRKAKLRLDSREGAFARLRHGGFAVVPGKLSDSELIQRVTSNDPGERMPPAKSGKHLTADQVSLLRKWIEEGAPWSAHWAFTPPRKPPLPRATASETWPKNPIDHFILARLKKEGLAPSPEADKPTLLRRVTLDLTGLPPTPAEMDGFLADRSPEAYEKVVDRLLESPRYGEHMARYWLDAARYGDTHGLHLDNYREMWPYRDWVIRAFNANLPYDRFIVEQLAGDLLPNATTDQLVASGFNRCHVSTNEGGAIEEEFYVRNVVDRVDTTSTVLLGLTVGCARCHDHKFDPIRSKDYYQLFAFFNSLDASALDGNATLWPPTLRLASPEQSAALKRAQGKVGALKLSIAAEVKRAAYDTGVDAQQSEVVQRHDYVWLDDNLPPGAKAASGGTNAAWRFVSRPDDPVLSGEKSVLGSTKTLSQQVFDGAQPALKVGEGDRLFVHVFIDPLDPPREIMLQWHAGNWEHRAYWGANVINFGKDGTAERLPVGGLPLSGKWVRLEVDAARVGLPPGSMVDGWALTQQGGTVWWDKAGIETWTPQAGQPPPESISEWVRRVRASGLADLPKKIRGVIERPRSRRTNSQKKQLRDYFVENVYAKTRSTFDPLHRQLAEAEKGRDELEAAIPATLVSRERAEPRPAYILKRGEYDRKAEEVHRDTPAFLPPFPPTSPRSRLGLAQWLVAPGQPLTSRVAVNRLWQQCFGVGLVKTAEDFGSQGEPPSHPELIDWLAVQFQDDGWNVKQMVKRIVMSATYRQRARVTPDRLAKDPANRLLSRGPRFRLDAEVIRDQALAVSGLLVERLGGPSVKPPQPYGLWEAVAYTSSNTAKFVADKGCERVHRRSMYTFWKRTASPPQMSILDAPSREACTVRRERTDTPVQALLLLNEEQFVECARGLAERTCHEGGASPGDRLAYMFRLATGRLPNDRELAELLAALQENLASYHHDLDAAKKLIAVGESKPDSRLDPSDLAAWTMVGNLILNLDEVINKG